MADVEAAWSELLDGEPVVVVDVRDADRVDRDDEDPLVERVGVLDLGTERQRGCVSAGVQEDGDAGQPHERGLLLGQAVEELVERSLLGDAVAGDDDLAAAPVDHHERQDQRDRQRQPRAVLDLGDVRAEERHLDDQEEHGDRREPALGGAPEEPGDGDEQHAC